MKLNWGHYIVAFFVFFASFIGYMVYKSYGLRLDLVSNQYYEDELAFQQKLDRMNNAAGIKEQISVEFNEGKLNIQLPAELKAVSGFNLKLLCMSDARYDKSFNAFKPTGGSLSVSTEGFKSGPYHLELGWEQFNKSYLIEKEISF